MKTWIQAARPKTLIAGIAPVCIGTIMAHSFNFWIFLATLSTVIWIQIGTNLANDYFDFKKGADSHLRIGPTRVMSSGLVTNATMKGAISIAFSLAILSCIPLIIKGGIDVSLLMFLAVLLGIGYTAGPYALAYLGLGDLFVIVFFGVIATGMTTYLQSSVYQMDAFWMGLAPGCLSTAILTLQNLRDRISDSAVNKKTIPVRFGERIGQVEYLLMMTLPYLVALVVTGNDCCLIALVPSLPLIIKVFRAKDPRDYIPIFSKTAAILALFTLAFAVGTFL